MIEAGNETQIRWDNGFWIFLDIGFSSKGRTCGLLLGDEEKPRCVRFHEAKQEIVQKAWGSGTLNFVIEAPLSVCFDPSGNPTGRSIEAKGAQTRYWYTGPGCAVMVASMYLLRELSDQKCHASVRLFEGFVSYKSGKSSHEEDVKALRDVVRGKHRAGDAIYGYEKLKAKPGHTLQSAFLVAGMDFGIPAVIKTGPLE